MKRVLVEPIPITLLPLGLNGQFTNTRRAQRAGDSFGWCARLRKVRVYSAAHTHTQIRHAPTSADRSARSTLARASACLARSSESRSPDVRHPRGERAVAWPGFTSRSGDLRRTSRLRAVECRAHRLSLSLAS